MGKEELEVKKFKCVRTCFHLNRMWEKDKPDEFLTATEAPEHFEEVKKKEPEVSDRVELIKMALSGLDHEDDALWTKGGDPRVEVVEDVIGGDFDTTRSEIEDADPDFKRIVNPLD